MEKALQQKLTTTSSPDGGKVSKTTTTNLITAIRLSQPSRRPRYEHVPPASFRRGEPLVIETAFEAGYKAEKVRLHYRHVNQAEDYLVEEMSAQGERYRQIIPGEYTDSPYPLLYFFEVHNPMGDAWMYPGLAPNLSNQLYFVIRAGKS